MDSEAGVKYKTQNGIALLIFVIVLAFAGIAYMLSNVSIEQLRYEEALASQTALKKAKQALLDYALTYEDGNPGEYGFLPCPDYRDDATPEGGSDGNCGATDANILGQLPWASLETGPLKSDSGSCLWYAVSGDYKSSPKTAMLNEDSNGSMRLYHNNHDTGAAIKQGANAEDRIVAIIFDPSKVLPGQNRNIDSTTLCGKDYAPAAYLEGDGVIDNSVLLGGALVIDEFIDSTIGTDERVPPFNDRLTTITRDELWDAVVSRSDFVANADSAMRRQAEALAMCIAAYGNSSGNRKLPRPAAIGFSGADYRVDGNYNDTAAASYLGRYPHTVDDSDATLGAVNAPNEAEPFLFNKGFCNSLAVGAGPAVNLDTVAGVEGYTTWKNWKDHFFYAVSAYYAPSSSADTGAPSCDGSNCIVVDGTEYAAVVLYSGSRTGVQIRNEPVAGDTDTKNALGNYIEVTNPAGDGTGDYTPTGNDIAYCITDTDPLTVVSCP